jgi:hypothetical protein
MLLIGFGNKARHGKDTAAEAILDFYGQRNNLFLAHGQLNAIKNIGIYKFADALYKEVNQFLKVYNGQDSIGTWQNFSPGLGTEVDIERWVYCNCEKHPPHEHNVYKNIMIPDWVTPEPNAVVSELAPYGKHPKLLQWWGTEFRRAQDENYWVNKLFASIPSNTDIAIVSDVRFPNEADGIVDRGGYNVNVQRLRKDGTVYYSSDRPVDHPSETALDGYNWQFRLTNHEGHQALLGEQAITLAEYLRGLK